MNSRYKNYATIRSSLANNPKLTESECIAAENAGAVLLKAPADVDYNRLPRDFYDTIETVLANPGVYTWIIFEDGAFIAAKTTTAAELHTKHFDLYEQHQVPVVMAGEMRVDASGHVEYNFQSGTYMGKMKMNNPIGYNETKFQTEMARILTNAGAASVRFVAESFIPSVVATRDALQKYRELGYNVTKFASLQDCRRYKNRKAELAYLDTKKRTYDTVKRLGMEVPDYDTWLRERLEKEKLLHYLKDVPPHTNYFAEGGRRRCLHAPVKTRSSATKKQRRKTRKSRR